MPAPEYRLYRIVVNDILARIVSGHLKAGDRLPSRRQMARDYDVSVSTIDRALTVLHYLGRIRGHQGMAMWVAELPPETGDGTAGKS
jgi:GntR family transcriptional regulator